VEDEGQNGKWKVVGEHKKMQSGNLEGKGVAR